MCICIYVFLSARETEIYCDIRAPRCSIGTSWAIDMFERLYVCICLSVWMCAIMCVLHIYSPLYTSTYHVCRRACGSDCEGFTYLIYWQGTICSTGRVLSKLIQILHSRQKIQRMLREKNSEALTSRSTVVLVALQPFAVVLLSFCRLVNFLYDRFNRT